MNAKRNRLSFLTVGIVVLASLSGCGSSDESVPLAKREASAGSCPNISSRTFRLNFINLTDKDLTFSASTRDCKFWSENGFPSHYNGLVVPPEASGNPSPGVRLEVHKDWKLDAAPTQVTFTLPDGTALGPAVTRLNDGSGNESFVEVFDSTKGDFVPGGSVDIGTVGGRQVQLVGSGPVAIHSWSLTVKYSR